MFDAEKNAAAVERARKKDIERTRKSYEFVLNDPRGRAFVAALCLTCHMFEPCKGKKQEGARQAALMVRNIARNLGMGEQFALALKEHDEYLEQSRAAVEQTEAKEEG